MGISLWFLKKVVNKAIGWTGCAHHEKHPKWLRTTDCEKCEVGRAQRAMKLTKSAQFRIGERLQYELILPVHTSVRHFSDPASADHLLEIMPLSELCKCSDGLTFERAAEEVRRLKKLPSETERLKLYGLYKQAIHGNIPAEDLYPRREENEWSLRKYDAWKTLEGTTKEEAKEAYTQLAKEMIDKYERKIVRSKWNSEVWTVDY
ncbi:hypothetical protein L596_001603 [Steinernema carpocapsae]|uniref:ACB domain-containing protein n=1 Tax=Steinernema carpocapsae TaxID=34508 RepID=A0A4U8UM01_STECR|nr:hypothetical protein L596_001603 [Steinernema carpocapsae]